MLSSDIFSEDIVLEVNPDDYMDATSHKDIFKQISEDFGLPLLSDDILGKDLLQDCGSVRDNNLLNEFFSRDNHIKMEPPSPPSSSSLSGESINDTSWASVLNVPASSESSSGSMEWRSPETPPISPQEVPSNLSPPVSPEVKHAPQDGLIKSTAAAGRKSNVGFRTVYPSKKPTPIVFPVHTICPQFQTVAVMKTSTSQPMSTNTNMKTGPMMLTQNDLLSLASQGILQFGTPPSNSAIVQPTTVISSKRPMPSVPLNVKQEVDVRVLKRQQRMIKNRESACLSRKKKKEYVQHLETVLKNVTNECERLRFENEQLKRRLEGVEKENTFLKHNSSLSLSSTKKATAFVAIVFMVSLNLGPLSGIFMTAHQKMVDPIKTSFTAHHSRSLLWVPDIGSEYQYDGSNESVVSNVSGIPAAATGGSANESIGNSNRHTCPMYINRTESMRLDSELRGWIFRSEKEKPSSPPLPPLPLPMKLKFEKNLPPLPRHKKYLERERLQNANNDNLNTNVHELQIYQNIPASYDEFLKAIKHREDTFYVVSFSGDHLLVPARAHNKTRRPLMSLVLPALSVNDSIKVPAHHIAMMQIDCEVVNTKLVNVKESYIPTSQGQQQPLPPLPRRNSDGNSAVAAAVKVGGAKTANQRARAKRSATAKKTST